MCSLLSAPLGLGVVGLGRVRAEHLPFREGVGPAGGRGGGPPVGRRPGALCTGQSAGITSLAAQARGGPGDNAPHAALRRVVWRLHAGFDCESFPGLCCLPSSVLC